MATDITETSFSDLTLVSRGKVRDVYATSDPDALLFVATDRISAYDVVLKNVSLAISLRAFAKAVVKPIRLFYRYCIQGIPGKGRILTSLSLFWFEHLKDVVPNHLITADIDAMPSELHKYKDVLQGRSMLVRKAKVIPIEAIVRGYITGTPRIAINAQCRI